MLAPILPELGGGYELRYTTGLRSRDTLPDLPTLRPLGRLRKEELLEEYQQAHCLLFPTRFEGFGYPVAEALSCGLPVVTSDCSCVPELVMIASPDFCAAETTLRLSLQRSVALPMSRKFTAG